MKVEEVVGEASVLMLVLTLTVCRVVTVVHDGVVRGWNVEMTIERE